MVDATLGNDCRIGEENCLHGFSEVKCVQEYSKTCDDTYTVAGFQLVVSLVYR